MSGEKNLSADPKIIRYQVDIFLRWKMLPRQIFIELLSIDLELPADLGNRPSPFAHESQVCRDVLEAPRVLIGGKRVRHSPSLRNEVRHIAQEK